MTDTEESKEKEKARQTFYIDFVEKILLEQRTGEEASREMIAMNMMARMSPEELMGLIKVIIIGDVVPAEFSERDPNRGTGRDILRQACAGMLAIAARSYPYSAHLEDADGEPS